MAAEKNARTIAARAGSTCAAAIACLVTAEGAIDDCHIASRCVNAAAVTTKSTKACQCAKRRGSGCACTRCVAVDAGALDVQRAADHSDPAAVAAVGLEANAAARCRLIVAYQ